MVEVYRSVKTPVQLHQAIQWAIRLLKTTVPAAGLGDFMQQRLSIAQTVDTYFDTRVRRQAPQGLKEIVTIALVWQRDTVVIMVHRLQDWKASTTAPDHPARTGDEHRRGGHRAAVENFAYIGNLRAMSSSRVSDTMEFSHCDPVPKNVAEVVIADAAKAKASGG